MATKSLRYKVALSYFKNVLANETRIQCLETEILTQQSRLTLNGADQGESVRHTLMGDAFERGFVRLYEFCDELDTDLIAYVEERKTALEVLAQVSDPKAYKILYLRYFEGMRFKEIERSLFLSETSIFRIHERALIQLYGHIPREFRQRRE